MHPPDPTAVWALAISALSFVAALWSSYVSHKALTHARESYTEDRRLAFAKEKSELLEVLDQNRALFDRTRIDIGMTKAIFDAEPVGVQRIMQPYTDLFTEMLPRVERGLRQVSTLWDEVFGWSEKTGPSALVHHQAKFRALLSNDQVSCESAQYCHKIFKEKLVVARQMYATGANP